MSENELPAVVDLIVRYDSRSGEMTLVTIPQAVPPETLFQMIYTAALKLREIELSQITQNKPQEN